MDGSTCFAQRSKWRAANRLGTKAHQIIRQEGRQPKAVQQNNVNEEQQQQTVEGEEEVAPEVKEVRTIGKRLQQQQQQTLTRNILIRMPKCVCECGGRG